MRVNLIYILEDPRHPGVVRYVGQTSQRIRARVGYHLSEARRKYGSKKSNYRCNWIGSLLKEGIEPKCLIIEKANESNYKEREKFWIKFYKDSGAALTNNTGGGEGGCGRKLSEEAKQNLRKVHLGMKHTQESKNKMSSSQKGHTRNRGRIHTPEARKNMFVPPPYAVGHKVSTETRKKIGAKSKGNRHCAGRVYSQEQKDRIRNSNLGQKRSEETRQKNRIASTGRRHTEDTKNKISNSLKGIPQPKETVEKRIVSRKNNKEIKALAKFLGLRLILGPGYREFHFKY